MSRMNRYNLAFMKYFFLYVQGVSKKTCCREPQCKSLTTYNVCFIRVRDLISFLVDQNLESIYENVPAIENRPRITAVVP